MSISLNDHERRIKALENKVLQQALIDCVVLQGRNSSDLIYGTTPKVSSNSNIFSVSGGVVTCPAGKYLCIGSSYGCKNGQNDGYFYPKLFVNSSEVSSYGRFTGNDYSRGAIVTSQVISLSQTSKVCYKFTMSHGFYLESDNFFTMLKIYYIFRYNIYNKFILRINSTFDNFVNIFTSFDLFGSFKRSVLRLTNHFTSQNEFYYLREVNYDMEIKSNILYYKILVLCYILLKQIFVYFSLLVDMEFYFYHFMGGEKI